VGFVYLQRQIIMEIKDYRYSNELRTKAKALPMYEEFIKLVDDDKKVQKYNTIQDMLLDAFKWDSSPQGQDYWQSVYDSIVIIDHPRCPKCNRLAKVTFSKSKGNYRCFLCKINYK
jgi:hypothetical protein